MLTVHHATAPVQPETPDDASAWLSRDTEPFHASPADEAYDLGYRLERDGEPARTPRGLSHAARLRWARGRREGRAARESAEAHAMGRMAALLTGESEPPSGLAPHEATAYRAGFAEGQEDAEFDEAYERARDGAEYGDSGISDFDVYPMGCVS